MTVLENMMLAAPRPAGRAARRRRAAPPRVPRASGARASERSSCSSWSASTGIADDFAGTLSGGQRKLLELARALMTEPRLLLLDEPMAGVTPALRGAAARAHPDAARASGITILFVEHDMDVVMRASDRVIVMDEGRVIARARPTRCGATSAWSTPTSARDPRRA